MTLGMWGSVLGLTWDTSGAVVGWASSGDVMQGLVRVEWRCALYPAVEVNWCPGWHWG